ncbi:MAG: hypothetical protein U0804_11295 [Gemmataceae bacterium]
MLDLPDYRTLRQANWDDCWFLSALVGMARQRPQQLRDCVVPLGDGVYRVTFPGRPPQDVRPDEVASGTESGPWPWARVCEAAAGRFGNLSKPRVFTYGFGIGLLTGRRRTGYLNVTRLGFAPMYRAWARRAWFRDLLEEQAGRRLMVLGGTDGRVRKPVHGWISPQHCYGLLGYDRGADRVHLRDPRGGDAPAERRLDGPGEFWLTAAETEHSFCGLSVERG